MILCTLAAACMGCAVLNCEHTPRVTARCIHQAIDPGQVGERSAIDECHYWKRKAGEQQLAKECRSQENSEELHCPS